MRAVCVVVLAVQVILCRAPARQTAPSLLLRVRGSLPVLVTPDDPQALVAALRQAGVSA